MRVLLTTPYDLAVPGGVNRHALDLLETLTQRGIEAKLVGPASAPVMADDERIVRLGRVKVSSLNGARSRLTTDLNIGGAMKRLIRGFKPDVIHLQEPFLPTLNAFAVWCSGRTFKVGTFHTFSENSRGYIWIWPWCRYINSRLDRRVAVSVAARDFATEYHPAEFTVIPNGARLPDEAHLRDERPPRAPAQVLFVGRADEPRKGFSVLQEAMARLEQDTPGRFVLQSVGPGTARGELTKGELSEAYRTADLCVVPSLGGESFGLVALEALAHGVPVVASRIRGYADWLDGAGVGELVPPGNATALAAAIREMMTDGARHAVCAKKARALAANYDWERGVDRLMALYHRD